MHTDQHASTTGVSERFFPCAPEQVAEARTWAAETYDAAGVDPEVSEVCRLLVSELATNSVVHARTAFTVRIHKTELWVEVCDHSCALPQRRDEPCPLTSEGGRGLELLTLLAEEYDFVRRPTGKVVCFRPKIAFVGAETGAQR